MELREMRVGIDARESSRPDTGIGNYAWHLVRALAAIDREDEFHIIVRAGERPSDAAGLPANVSWVPVGSFAVGRLQDQIGVPLAVGGRDLDLFHVLHHDATPLGAGVPLIVTVHDLAALSFPDPSWIHRGLFRGFSGLALSRARHLICDSRSTGREIDAAFPGCVGKWSVIPLGVDPYYRLYDKEEEFARLAARLGVGPSFMLYVGSFARRKNLTNMIRAFSAVKRGRPGFEFVVVGGASGRDDEFPVDVPEGVRVVGKLSKGELRQLYNRAAVLLFATWHEGFGLPVLEAMACGCPVVTSCVSSLPEIGGDAAVYVRPDRPDDIARGVLRVLEEKLVRATLVEKGLARVLRFNWEEVARGVLEVYRQHASINK